MIPLQPWCLWARHRCLVEAAACDLRQCWQRISGALKKSKQTPGVCTVVLNIDIKSDSLCTGGLRSSRPLKGMKDKVLLPIMAQQSGSVGNIQLEMGGCRVQRRKRRIKGNLTVFSAQKEREESPNIVCSVTRCFISMASTRSTGSRLSMFCHASINLKVWNEREYISVNVNASTFHLNFCTRNTN